MSNQPLLFDMNYINPVYSSFFKESDCVESSFLVYLTSIYQYNNCNNIVY